MRRSVSARALAVAGAAVVLVSAAAVVTAQSKLNVKLGLWENVGTMEGMPPGEPQKLCITAEKLATGNIDPSPSMECTHAVTGSTATTMDVKETCTMKDVPGATATSTVHVQALTPESVKGTVAATMSMSGRSMQTNGTFTSKWIAASCGDIK